MKFTRWLCFGLFTFLTVCSVAWCQATVNENLETAFIYVDTSNGSDSNPGTATLPLKTIGAAVSLAETNNANNVGSRVIINPGVYREAVTIAPPHNVTSMPITFEAAVNGTTYVSGAQQYTGWQVDGGNNNIYTNAWAYAWGLCDTLVPGAPAAPDIVLRREMVFVNGTQLTQVLSLNEVTVDTFYVDESAGTIYMWPPTGINVNTADVEVAVQPTVWSIQGQSNIVVRGLTFEYANTCRESGAVVVSGVNLISNILFDTDSFVWNNAQGLSLNPTFSYFTVQNSTANHNGEAGFQATETTYGLYQSDQANYNNWRGAQGAYYLWNNAASHFYNMHNLTVNNLETAYNQTYGIHFDTDNDNVTVSSMTSYGNSLASVLMEVSEGPLTFSKSTFCGTAPLNSFPSQIGFALRDSMNVTVTQDNFVNNNLGLAVTGIEGGIPIKNWQTGQQYQAVNENFTFTNNIIEGNGDGSGTDQSVGIYLDAATSNALVSGNICRSCGQWAWQLNWGSNNTIQNNIFDLSAPGTQLALYQDFTGLHGMAGNVFTRNLVYFANQTSLYSGNILAGDMPITASRNLYYSPNGARIQAGAFITDSYPIYSDPLFASPAAGNYSMPPSSPAYSAVGFVSLPVDQGPLPSPPPPAGAQHKLR